MMTGSKVRLTNVHSLNLTINHNNIGIKIEDIEIGDALNGSSVQNVGSSSRRCRGLVNMNIKKISKIYENIIFF